MAPPAVQALQQLILDRKVEVIRSRWLVYLECGNRKEDFAAVFDMPAPLAKDLFT